MPDLGLGFQKLDTRHKASRRPTAVKPHLEPVKSKPRAIDYERRAAYIGIITAVAAYIVVAKWMGWWL